MQIRSCFIDNEIREMTPKDPDALKESYLEYYESVPFRESAERTRFVEMKNAFAAFVYFSRGFVSDYYESEEKNLRNLNELISCLQEPERLYGNKTLSYLDEMKEIKQKAKICPPDEQAIENYEFLKLRLEPFVELIEIGYDHNNGRSFLQEALFFFEPVRPSYVMDVNPLINALLNEGFDFNDRKGQKIIDTWISIGKIPAVRDRYDKSLNGNLTKEPNK